MTKLFLDDVRYPPDNTWDVVRSFEAFVSWMESYLYGAEDCCLSDLHISFDHDLGDGVPTGMDCAKWLVAKEIYGFSFAVHSANPPGKANIEGLLNNWLAFCKDR